MFIAQYTLGEAYAASFRCKHRRRVRALYWKQLYPKLFTLLVLLIVLGLIILKVQNQ